MVEVVLVLAGGLFQAACPAALKARSSKVVFGVRLAMLSNPCKIEADLEIIAIDILSSTLPTKIITCYSPVLLHPHRPTLTI